MHETQTLPHTGDVRSSESESDFFSEKDDDDD